MDRTKKGGLVFAVVIAAFFLTHSAALVGAEYISIFGGNNVDNGNHIVFDSAENSFVIVGTTNSIGIGGFNGFITKYKPSIIAPFIELDWAKAIGTMGSDQANCVIIADDGHYVLCGFVSRPRSSKQDLLLAKFKKDDGSKAFAYSYDVVFGTDSGKSDRSIKMIQDNNDNFVVVGTTFVRDNKGDILVAKFDSSGIFKKAMIFDGGGTADSGSAIIQDAGNKYVVAGYTETGKDIVMLKLDPDRLIPVVSKRLHISDNFDFAWQMVESLDRCYVLAGRTTKDYSGVKWSDLLIFKINNAINAAIWGTSLKNSSRSEVARDLIKVGDKFVVAGFSNHTAALTTGTRSDAFFARFSAGGGLEWSKITKSPPPPIKPFSFNRTLSITRSGGFYTAVGTTNSAARLLPALGNFDVLITSFEVDDTKCFGSSDSVEVRVEVQFHGFGPHFPCTLNRTTPIGVGNITPNIRNICK